LPDINQIIVITVLIFLVIALYKEFIGTALSFIIAVIVLGVSHVLTPSEILGGFANEQIAVILMLLLLGDVYRQTSVLDIFFDWIFKSAKSERNFMTRMMLVVAPLSGFLNNTPLVALLIPYVHSWSKRNKKKVSKLLMPLSFAAILGGCATLIGTSTNLIVNGLVTDQIAHSSVTDKLIVAGLKPLGIFDFAAVGIPMIIIGIIYMLTLGRKLLPDRKDIIEKFSNNEKKYIVEARISKGSDIIGKSIKEANLRNLDGLFLSDVIRKDIVITSAPNDTILQEEDILLFTGNTDSVLQLVDSKPGFEIPSVGMFARKKNTEVLEIVVSHNSSFIRKTLKELNFRAKYDGTAIAIHRNGKTLSGKLGLVRLEPGDSILLLTGTYFPERMANSQDFYLISRLKEIQRIGTGKTIFLVAGTIAVILFSILGYIKLFNGLMVLLTGIVLLKIARPKQLAKSIDYELAIIIALSLALGTAMMKTGVADFFASGILSVFRPFGNVGILAGIYVITSILAAFVTNKAAVAVVFPVALSLAIELGSQPLPFILVVAFAAAANFMTPIGYQTNLMIYGPGGYRFRDFLRVGTPLTFIYGIVTIIVLGFMYF